MAGWHRCDHVTTKIPDEPGPPARPWPQYLPLRCHRTMKIETPAAAFAKKMGCSWSANAKTDRLIRLGTGNTTARTPVGYRLFTAPSTFGYSSCHTEALLRSRSPWSATFQSDDPWSRRSCRCPQKLRQTDQIVSRERQGELDLPGISGEPFSLYLPSRPRT